MPDIYFITDHHFGHANIIEFCERPFTDVDQMDAVLIRRWNTKVAPDDQVYHLGDFTLGEDAESYFKQLNGRIRILGISWHHDRRWLPRRNILSPDMKVSNLTVGIYPFLATANGHPIEVLPPMHVIEMDIGEKYPHAIVLCHYPLAEWDRKHYGAWHLHGHSHGKYRGNGLIMDIGVDNHDFYPVSLNKIEKTFVDV